MNPFNNINATLSDLLTPDIHTPGVPRGHGAVVAYSPARVQEIIEAVRQERRDAVAVLDERSADPFTYIIQHLNSNPYSLTKGECVTLVKELRDKYTGPGAKP